MGEASGCAVFILLFAALVLLGILLGMGI